MEQKIHKFHVHGMHCKSCVILTESELLDHEKISHVKADLGTCCVEIHGEFGDKTAEEIADELSLIMEKHGYKISTEKEQKKTKWSDFKIAVPVVVVFSLVFVILQKVGLVNLVGGDSVTYGTSFLIGIIASLSTCMAVVGGLLLSMSATFAKEGDRIKPQVLFHAGRIVAFFILGGVIGALGSAFTLSTTLNFVLSVVIGMVMLILGINLLDVFPWAKKLQPSMPKFVSRYVHNASRINHTLTPLLVGVATFFLPCGFTQSMQLYTLTTGNFLNGALTMFFFALGTLPVLALLSFSSFSIKESSKSGIFFKSAGLIVIMFALFNIINSLAVIGVIPPLFNF
jgi:uncharacterized protein